MRPRSQEEDQLSITKLQNFIRARNAYEQVEKKTNLNIAALSERNLTALKQRLSNGTFLPEKIKTLIQKEKMKPSDMLTPAELDLYSLLLATPIYINHATPESDKIEQSGVIHSKASLKANDIDVTTHTPDSHGQEYYVFFSYGLKPDLPLVVNFLCGNNTFIANLDDLQRKAPIIMSGSWCSGHFYAYDMEQTPSPITYQYQHSYTTVQTQYWVAKKPIIQHYRKLTFTYPDFTQAVFQLERSEEIAAGNDIKRWHALKLIEFVRFLHPEIRKYILANYINTSLLKYLFDSIFTPGKAEFHFPYQYKHGWSLEKRDKINLSESEQALEALLNNDLVDLEKFVKSPAAKFYRYEFTGIERLSLMNVAVLRNNQPAVILLLQSGFDPTVEYINTQQNLFVNYAERTALQDVVEVKNEPIIKLLLNHPASTDTLAISHPAYATFSTMQTAIVVRCNESILRSLLVHLPKLDGVLEQLLLLASYYNSPAVINVLLENGADINKSCKLRQTSDNAHLLHTCLSGTPLTIAAEYGCYDAVVCLLQHKASSNQPARHDYSRYLNGNSPLMAAIDGLTKKDRKLKSYAERVTNQYYLNNRAKSEKSYLDIINILIKSGANLQYCDDNKRNVMKCIEDCLQGMTCPDLKKLLEELQKSAPQSVIHINHPIRTAAIITSKNENNELLVLIGKVHSYNDQIYLDVPGGEVDYQADDNLLDSIVTITGAQTNLNLKEAALLSEKTFLLENRKFGNKQVFHFHFRSPILPFIRNLDIYGSRDIKPLVDTSWVRISDLQLSKIKYQGKNFFMFYYNGLPLPLYICPRMAKLSGMGKFDIDEQNKMVEYFSQNAEELAANTIKPGQLDDLIKNNKYLLAKLHIEREAPARKKYHLNDGIENHAHLIFTETYLQPFPGKPPKEDLYTLPVERVSHGVQHATRTCIFTKMFINFYKTMGHPEALKMTEEDVQLLQITALCHDAMRKNDQLDKWEKQSAQYCEKYLLHIGVSPEKAKLFAGSIVNRMNNLYGRILQSADCLEIPRVAKTFYINRLAVFQDARPACRCVLFEMVKQAIQLQARQHDLKHPVKVKREGRNEVLFSAEATRCPEKPELKQFYEQHPAPYSNTLDELKDYPLLIGYFYSSHVHQPPCSTDEKDWVETNNPHLLFSRQIAPEAQVSVAPENTTSLSL